jgi:hypothetical protein
MFKVQSVAAALLLIYSTWSSESYTWFILSPENISNYVAPMDDNWWWMINFEGSGSGCGLTDCLQEQRKIIKHLSWQLVSQARFKPCPFQIQVLRVLTLTPTCSVPYWVNEFNVLSTGSNNAKKQTGKHFKMWPFSGNVNKMSTSALIHITPKI